MQITGILLFILFCSGVANGQKITQYEPFIASGVTTNNKQVIILRKFIKDNHVQYFTINPELLSTQVISAGLLTVQPAAWKEIYAKFIFTPYIRSLREAASYSDPIQDAGFRRFRPIQHGIDLTIDLCPSHRPLDKLVFTDLIKEMGKIEKPVPVAASVTGLWMNSHPGDLRWLDSLVMAGDLSILWINHSYHHFTQKNLPLRRNFLLEPGTNIKDEVLNTEIDMLERGITPSCFFRFPGLVSDREIYDDILQLGLIPVGSDAWLAKGQWPQNGSIVLIHANGNEPLGIRDFIKLLQDKQQEVLSKQWELFDLRESLMEDETKH